MTINCSDHENSIKQLERELDEMTVALSQAWDQLVPFLQEMPPEAETTQDIEPILHTVAAAADADLAGVYLFKVDEWHSIPDPIRFEPTTMQKLAAITQAQALNLVTKAGREVYWVFAPVITEKEYIGVLGIGTYDPARRFTAVELRIIVRMAERIGNQITAALLSRLREKEMIQKHEMDIGNRIQQSVQPNRPPKVDRLQLASYWQPAREVGGDAWGWVQVTDERLVWFILDVAGKGLPAALAAVALHTAISMALHMRMSPVNVISAINTQFYDAFTRTDLMATVAILSINTKTGTLELANAGHPPVLVRHHGTWLRLQATAPPVGVLPMLQAEAQFVSLCSDDLVIAYSDGFTEIETEKRLWGQTGLLNVIPCETTDAQSLIESIVEAAHRAGSIADDQTLIAAIYTGA